MVIFNKQELRRNIARHMVNYRGWRTSRKIIVIESDDWGAIRMPSKVTYNVLLKKGLKIDNSNYNRIDTLADHKDLSFLFEVLSTVKDKNGNHPIITANSVVANPDFERIKASGFSSYFYEPFTETLKRDKRTENAFDLWKEGMASKLFHPQFHGREHLNVVRWMRDLREGLTETRIAFDFGFYGFEPKEYSLLGISYMAAMDYNSKEDQLSKFEIIQSGLQLFKEIFGYSSNSYIATNYRWGNELNEILSHNGVKYIQGIKKQGQPQIGEKIKYIRRILGEKNDFGQTYLIRNCTFEPSLYPRLNQVDYCLNDIKNAFSWHKPAIISSHRINYMGGIEPENRDSNLKKLSSMLQKITNKWPDVEFITSPALGEIITSTKSAI